MALSTQPSTFAMVVSFDGKAYPSLFIPPAQLERNNAFAILFNYHKCRIEQYVAFTLIFLWEAHRISLIGSHSLRGLLIQSPYHHGKRI
jgi:hypothetical protein